MKTIFLLLVISALTFSAAQEGNGGGNSTTALRREQIRDKYHLVEVDPIDVKQGVEFPTEYVQSLQEEIPKLLVSSKVFERVVNAGEQPAQPSAPLVRLSATIHNYKKGSRTERYFLGYGKGTSEVDVRVVFFDGATGQPLVVEEIRAILAGGYLGGNEDKISWAVAKQMVTQTKLMLARRVPAPTEGALTTTAVGSSASPPDGHMLTISAKNWDEGEQKLTQEAAAGYRVVDMSLTGSSTAELELEKLAAPPEVYQYRWVRVHMATHLQKDINRATADGFHASVRTLAWLGPFLSVLMEKPPVPSATQYQYLVAQPLRLSSAQKDIENHEREGYTLLDETDAAGFHILLFEKATEKMETAVTKK